MSIALYVLVIMYAGMKAVKVITWMNTDHNSFHKDSWFTPEFVWSSRDGMNFAFGITAYDDN